jgi:hypothetical protein
MTYEELLTLRAYRSELLELLNRGEDDNIVLVGHREGIILSGKRDLTPSNIEEIHAEIRRLDWAIKSYVKPRNGGGKPTARKDKPPTQNRGEMGKGRPILRDIRNAEKDKIPAVTARGQAVGKRNVKLMPQAKSNKG